MSSDSQIRLCFCNFVQNLCRQYRSISHRSSTSALAVLSLLLHTDVTYCSLGEEQEATGPACSTMWTHSSVTGLCMWHTDLFSQMSALYVPLCSWRRTEPPLLFFCHVQYRQSCVCAHQCRPFSLFFLQQQQVGRLFGHFEFLSGNWCSALVRNQMRCIVGNSVK